jgi:hypothetical protein
MPKADVPRIAIIGAGPVGLEAALHAKELGFPCMVCERGRSGEHWRRWGHVRLFTPFGMNSTPLGRAAILAENRDHEFPPESEHITGRQHVALYLEPLARLPGLSDSIRLETQVLKVGRRGCLKEDNPDDGRREQQSFRLLVRDSKKTEHVEEADVVFDCTGTYAQHRWLGDGGIPALGELAAESWIGYSLEDVLGERKNHYAGKNILVVGAGYSAATTVINLAKLGEDHPDTWVVWLGRGSGSQPIKRIANDPLRERDRLAAQANMLATRGDRNVEFHAHALVESVESTGPDRGFRVTARCAGTPRTWEVDRIIANVGYTPDTGLYRELQVHESPVSLGPINLATMLQKHSGGDRLMTPAREAQALPTSEPNFFVLGSKSYGRNSSFLLRTGFDQVREVFALLTGRMGLGLYKKR